MQVVLHATCPGEKLIQAVIDFALTELFIAFNWVGNHDNRCNHDKEGGEGGEEVHRDRG